MVCSVPPLLLTLVVDVDVVVAITTPLPQLLVPFLLLSPLQGAVRVPCA